MEILTRDRAAGPAQLYSVDSPWIYFTSNVQPSAFMWTKKLNLRDMPLMWQIDVHHVKIALVVLCPRTHTFIDRIATSASKLWSVPNETYDTWTTELPLPVHCNDWINAHRNERQAKESRTSGQIIARYGSFMVIPTFLFTFITTNGGVSTPINCCSKGRGEERRNNCYLRKELLVLQSPDFLGISAKLRFSFVSFLCSESIPWAFFFG